VYFWVVKPVILLLLLNFFKTPCAYAQVVPTPFQEHAANALVPEYNVSTQQPETDSTPTNKRKVVLIASIHAGAYVSTLAILGAAWYKGYAKTPFHVFNDSKEWLQMDKAGHAWTAYTIANYSSHLWQWAGWNQHKAAVVGGISALGYQTILEYLDAHSAKWGWSWADMGANTFGAALFTTQELLWNEQKVSIRFSSFPQHYEAALQPRVDDLFGTTFPERLLKDYNAQTYWASFNLKSIFTTAPFPKWLNLAVGYGANGMYGGFKNMALDKDGNVVFDRSDIKRVRVWYLSPDIDWTKFNSNKKLVRTLFSLLNMIKVPAPALQLSSGKVKAQWVSF